MAKPSEESAPRLLDPKVKIIWASGIVLLAALLWAMLTIFSQMAFPEGVWGVQSFHYPFVFFVITAAALTPYLIWVELRYRNYTYYLTDMGIIIKKGVLRHERISIPFYRVQNVNVSRSIFERVLGLATIKIETAGTNPGEAEGVIPGVANYRKVVEEILEMIEHKRHTSQQKKHVDVEMLVSEIATLKEELHKLREENAMLKNRETKKKFNYSFEERLNLEKNAMKEKSREITGTETRNESKNINEPKAGKETELEREIKKLINASQPVPKTMVNEDDKYKNTADKNTKPKKKKKTRAKKSKKE